LDLSFFVGDILPSGVGLGIFGLGYWVPGPNHASQNLAQVIIEN